MLQDSHSTSIVALTVSQTCLINCHGRHLQIEDSRQNFRMMFYIQDPLQPCCHRSGSRLARNIIALSIVPSPQMENCSAMVVKKSEYLGLRFIFHIKHLTPPARSKNSNAYHNTISLIPALTTTVSVFPRAPNQCPCEWNHLPESLAMSRVVSITCFIQESPEKLHRVSPNHTHQCCSTRVWSWSQIKTGLETTSLWSWPWTRV